jgi:hypothetical protein
MTNEERQRMCDDLRRCKSSWLEDVADEIERLAEELQYQYACDKAQQQEIERLFARNKELPKQEQKMTDKERSRDKQLIDQIERLTEELQYQHACGKDQQQEIERLSIENDWLRTALRAAQTAPKALAADRSGPADYVPPGGAGNGA